MENVCGLGAPRWHCWLCSIQVNRAAVGIPTAAGKWPRMALCLTDEAELSQCRDTIVQANLLDDLSIL
jgi:hypothetical protein